MNKIYYLLIFSLFISCNPDREDDEEFDYYEPIIGEEFQTMPDVNNKVEYEYQPQNELIVKTEDDNGIKYTIEIPASAIWPRFSESFNGYIVPLTGIQNLPEGVNFQFGLEIEPYGIRFIKPVKITIDLPANFNTQNLRGFYNEGHGGMAYLEPLKIKRSSGKTEAIFEVLHFSSYGGIKVEDNDLDCPDPRSAQTCDNLREIVACTLGSYEVGTNEKLSQRDQEAVNKILKTWMEEQLKYTDGGSIDYSDLYEFEFELSQYQCWKAMTQEFNSNPESVFSDLYQRAEDYIIDVIADIMVEADSLCVQDLSDDEFDDNGELIDNSECLVGASMDLTKSYLQWLGVAQMIGIETDPRIIDLFEFCDGAVINLLEDFKMVHAESLIEVDIIESSGTYFMELGTSNDIIQVQYVMKNLLGEPVVLPDSTIKWVEESKYGGATKGAFIYENGTIKLNKTPELIYALTACQTDPAACSEWEVFSVFKIYRNNCWHGSVRIFWEWP